MTTALQTHQSLRQLTGNDEVYGAVTGSCGTKVCFQVGGDDARKMADKFGGFVAADLMNLPKLHALARVGPRDASFNLETFFLPAPERPAAEAAADLRERTRRRYVTPKADIRKELEALREFLPKRTPVDPFSAVAAKAKQERKAREAAAKVEAEEPAAPVATEYVPPVADTPHAPTLKPGSQAGPEPTETPELKSGKAEATKNAIIQAAGAWGYSYRTEKPILGKTRQVDLVLKKADLVVAYEISATTSAPHEVGNVLKCLQEGFARIIHVCDSTARRRHLAALVAAQCSPDDLRRIEFLTTRQTIARLGELAMALPGDAAQATTGKTVFGPVEPLSADDREAAKDAVWGRIAANMARDRRKLPPSV